MRQCGQRAIFCPLPEAGLIVVDEEHDGSYKQQDGIRYHARDLALVRASKLGIPVLLGSATPSLESLHNALAGRYGHLRLAQRAGGARPPGVRVVDVGARQNGRERAGNVVHAESENAEAVRAAVARAIGLTPDASAHPYGAGVAGELSAAALAAVDPREPKLVRKRCAY